LQLKVVRGFHIRKITRLTRMFLALGGRSLRPNDVSAFDGMTKELLDSDLLYFITTGFDPVVHAAIP